MLHRHLQRHGIRIFRQGRRNDHGTVVVRGGWLRVDPTWEQEREGPSNEQGAT
jgi:hypothetical protein